jgi:hypothetical protein
MFPDFDKDVIENYYQQCGKNKELLVETLMGLQAGQ